MGICRSLEKLGTTFALTPHPASPGIMKNTKKKVLPLFSITNARIAEFMEHMISAWERADEEGTGLACEWDEELCLEGIRMAGHSYLSVSFEVVEEGVFAPCVLSLLDGDTGDVIEDWHAKDVKCAYLVERMNHALMVLDADHIEIELPEGA